MYNLQKSSAKWNIFQLCVSKYIADMYDKFSKRLYLGVLSIICD